MLAPLKWLILSLQFATVLPTPQLKHVSENDIRRSVVWFPLLGMLLGVVIWAIQYAFWRSSPWVASVVSLTAYTLLTGALHLDGLLDTADAVGSRRPADIALEIMKDSRVGAMGVIAAVLAMGGKFAAFSALGPASLAPYVVVPMLSRLGMVWAMFSAPAARDKGLGALFAKQVPVWVVLVASAVVLAACSVFIPLVDCLWIGGYFILVTAGLTYWMVRRFGGMTGDTYGALNEVLEWVGWVLFVVIR